MRLLLDTHVLLWSLMDAPELSRRARIVLTDAEALYVSSVSFWEIAIKRSLGKLQLDELALDEHVERIGIQPLPVTWAHARVVRGLPPHHRDPFDRMLVAQAISEPLHLLTHDGTLRAYSDLVMLV